MRIVRHYFTDNHRNGIFNTLAN